MLESLHNEASLVERAISGDAEAFGGLYAFHLEAIYRYILVRVSDINDAEDLTEQVFLKAWEALPGYEQRECRFASWLYRIAHNVVIDHYRLQKRTIPASLLEVSDWDARQPTTLDKVIADEERDALVQAVECLPEEQRRVIFLRFVEGMNHAEIARILDKSRGACRIIQHRALTALNHLLNSTLSVILALLLLLGGTVVAASRALPGSQLYPVKKTIEALRLAMTTDPAHTARLHLTFAASRLDEATTLVRQGHTDHIDLALNDYSTQLNSILLLLDHPHTLSLDERIAIAQHLLETRTRHERQFTSLHNRVPPHAHRSLEAAITSMHTTYDRAQAIIDAEHGSTSPPTTATPTTATPTTMATATSTPTATPSSPSAAAAPGAAAMAPTAQASPTAFSSPQPLATAAASPAVTALPTALPPDAVLPPATATPLPSATLPPPTTTPTLPPPTATPTLPSPTATVTPPSPTMTPTPTVVPPTPTRTVTPTAPAAPPTITPQTAPFPDNPDDETDPDDEGELLPLPTLTATPTPSPAPEVPAAPVESDAGQLTVVQAPSPDTLTAGATLTYTIRLQNNTTTEVTVEMINRLPRVVRYISGSATHGGTYLLDGLIPDDLFPGDLLPDDLLPDEAHILYWEEIIVPAAREVVISFQVVADDVDEPTQGMNVLIVVVNDEVFELEPVAIMVMPAT